MGIDHMIYMVHPPCIIEQKIQFFFIIIYRNYYNIPNKFLLKNILYKSCMEMKTFSPLQLYYNGAGVLNVKCAIQVTFS